MSEGETASYVLAYLLKKNYTLTARNFLVECNELPSKSLIVLPETPLQSVVAKHKSQSDARVMVNTLGESSALHALWSKLDVTLQQIKSLSLELLVPSSRGGGRGHRRPMKSKFQASQTPSPVTFDLAQSTTTVSSSPHRRKPVPKRKPPPSNSNETAESAAPLDPPPSPSMQQVLDTFLGDDSLPGKLADVINRCVTSDPDVELSSELSSHTLDSILTDPALEGLFSQPPESSDNTSDGAPAEKRMRLEEIPTEKDIDDFLDQVHKLQ